MRMTKILVLFATAALLTACANQKEPAEKAVRQAEAALSAFKTDAQQYAAEDLKVVEDSIDRLKTQLANKEYKTVIMQTPNVASSVAELKSTVAKKKAEAEEVLAAAQQEWTELSASVPEMVTKLQAKVDSLAKSRRVPQGLDKASFEAAKQEFEALKTSWAEAGAEFSSGMVADAVRRARAAKAKGEELMQKFGA
jgi:ActR/RegA family two-component response regulator